MKRVILLVDVDDHYRTALGEILEEEGYAVRSARTAAGASSLLDDGLEPCCVLVDLLAPDGEHRRLLETLLGHPRYRSSIVCTTALTSARLIDDLALPGHVPLLRKPIDLATLLAVLEERCRVE